MDRPGTSGFVERYAEVTRTKGRSLRDRARDLALNMACAWDRRGAEGWLSAPRVQFIYIHHVFRDEEKALEEMLRALSEQHVFISHSEAWKKVISGDIDRPYISFSSDDGFHNNVRAAAILKEHGVSGCFFICPSMIGIDDLDTVTAFCRERLHLPPVKFMGWDDVERLLASGHEIGSHTMDHVNVSEMSAERLEEEIGGAARIMEERTGSAGHFAFPYGRFHHFNGLGREIAFRCGHLSCSSAERGCHMPRREAMAPSDLLIRRDHVLLDWPLTHIKYFLARNAAVPAFQQNGYPY